jgi:hypothetical protein
MPGARLASMASAPLVLPLRLGERVLRIGFKGCPYCHRYDICSSHPKSLLEEVAMLLLLRPVRCRDCMRRFCRPLFVATPLAPEAIGFKRPVQPVATPKNNEDQRSG